MNSQQEADLLLGKWQALRALAPEERIERLMSDFWTVPIESDFKFEDQLRAVAMEIAS